MHVLPLFVLLQLSRRFASLIKIILLTVYLDFLTDFVDSGNRSSCALHICLDPDHYVLDVDCLEHATEGLGLLLGVG